MNKKGYIKEVFSSYQGEGKYVGAKQIFIRFAGCSINCKGCDTNYTVADYFYIDDKKYKNPVTSKELLCGLKYSYDFKKFHSIAITGGEPLEQFEFLNELAIMLKKEKIKLFLETSGFYSEKLLNIIDLFDIFSIDVKLTSVFGVKCSQDLFEVLKQIPDFKYYLKLVLNNKVDFNELNDVLLYLEGVNIDEIYTQPFNEQLSLDILELVNDIFSEKGIKLFFVPQIHKILRIR